MGEWLGLAKPHLSADASVWVFASPDLTSAVESVVAQQFRVLNSVRWVKEQGWHKRSELAAARSFLSPWEGIIFAEQFGADGSVLRGSGYDAACAELSAGVFEPLRKYLDAERVAAGWTVRRVAEAYQGVTGSRTVTGMAGHWFQVSQWTLPTAENYEWLQGLFNADQGDAHLRREYAHLRREYEDLRREYEDLRREYEDLRRPFNMKARNLSTDIFTFGNVGPYQGKHPCEKPLGLLAHIIETTTRPGDTILDPFAGSSAILDAARQLGRQAVGIEMDAHWCEQSARRLSQQALDFGALA